ncbi:MAG: hypothetical protein LBD97_00250 [Bifidobacteriaceae bacterium]|jgi:hypothetical protein|nr:hypothetical protein [Bifidobacteriaceae bacterium]
MNALITLGLRLVRAGGPVRGWSIAVGNAVGVWLILTAWALPAAIYPNPAERYGNLIALAFVVVFLLTPALVLLITVGRLSSGVRDRRLAGLRLLGLSPAKTRAVAAVENAVLALAGALTGLLSFQLSAAPLADAVAPLSGPVQVGAAAAAVSVALVTALSVAVGIGATWSREMPGQARSEAKLRKPGWWRLIPLAVGVGCVAATFAHDPLRGYSDVPVWVFLFGSAVAVFGVAVSVPLVSSLAARALVAMGRATPLLAGRAIQADSAGSGRVVAGLGVAVALSMGGLGVLAGFEETSQFALAARAYGPGPQDLWIGGGLGAISEADIADVQQVEGVIGVAPRQMELYCPPEECWGENVLVGTCEQLRLVHDAVPCDDSRAMLFVRPPSEADWESEDAWEGPFVLQYQDEALEPTPGFTIEPTGEPVVLDPGADADSGLMSFGGRGFIPVGLIDEELPPRHGFTVLAVGGVEVQERLRLWAEERGQFLFLLHETTWQFLQTLRLVIWSLCASAVGVALLLMTLGGIDRARERRRAVSRQVMVGVNGGVLRVSQLCQSLIPAVAAVLLGMGVGLLGAAGYVHLGGVSDGEVIHGWPTVAALAALGCGLAAVSALPLIRTRLTPDVLRRE